MNIVQAILNKTANKSYNDSFIAHLAHRRHDPVWFMHVEPQKPAVSTVLQFQEKAPLPFNDVRLQFAREILKLRMADVALKLA